jgi:aminobenzoyl-glutamate utilization protein A
VIPELAVIKLETRGETTELNEYMLDKAYKVLNGAAVMYDVEMDVKKVGEAGTAECDEELVTILTEIAKGIPEFDNIVKDHKLGGSEDASVLMAKVQEHGGKAAYVFLGSKIAAGHHNSKFDFDETVLERGYKVFTHTVKKLNGV